MEIQGLGEDQDSQNYRPVTHACQGSRWDALATPEAVLSIVRWAPVSSLILVAEASARMVPPGALPPTYRFGFLWANLH